MPDENSGTAKPGPVEVRIHRSQDPPVDVSLDSRMGLPFDPPIDVSLDQPIDQIGESSRGSSDPRLAGSSDPRSAQASEWQVARSSEPQVVSSVDPRVDRSYPRFGQSLDPQVAGASERPTNRWLPVAAALVIGALGGYAAGFIVGQRDRSPRPDVEPQAEVAPQAGQSFTESTVPSKSPEVVEPPEARAVDPAPVSEAGAKPGRGASPSPAVSPGNSGSLLVRSVPSGARVVLDGEPRGVTPLALRSLTFGMHNVEVTYLGYEPRQRRVALTAERPAQSIDFELRTIEAAAAASSVPSRSVPADTPGALRVDSRPRGARVFLDNKPVGLTPLVVPGIRAGSHAVRLEMEGYHSWSTSVNVDAGGSARVAASLETQENR